MADVCCCDGEEGQVLKTEWTLTNGPAGGDGEIAGASRLSPSQGLNLPSSQGASILIHPQNIPLFQALLFCYLLMGMRSMSTRCSPHAKTVCNVLGEISNARVMLTKEHQNKQLWRTSPIQYTPPPCSQTWD